MLSLEELEHSHDNVSETSLLNPSVDTELELWRKLVFSFDMDNGESSDNNPTSSGNTNPDRRNARRSRSRSHSVNQQGSNVPTLPRNDLHDAFLLAQFQAAAGSGIPPPPTTQDASYNALLLALLQSQTSQHAAPPNIQSMMNNPLYAQHLLPPSNLNFGAIPPQFQWPPSFGHQQQPNFPFDQPGMAAHLGGFPSLPPINTNVSSGAGRSTSVVPLNSPPTAASDDTTTDPADLSVVEDKRRRNTAASARFRIKKKQRNLNLERTVSDLSGRADELEKEAADLRRENGWLKEIVMLKGSRLAGLDVSPQNLPKPPEGDASAFWSPSGSGSSQPVAGPSRRSNQTPQDAERDSDSESDSDGSTEGPSVNRKEGSLSKGKERQR
ncbi:hypothetical protein EV361DRAFT_912244 [Lentinula raphanica]|nr:hypothetical protein EV361DRAFT_912244 [Lentinula raphanica]